MAERTELGGLLEALPAPPMEADRRAAMRFALMAAARARANEAPRVSRRAIGIGVGAIATAVAVALAFALRSSDAPRAVPAEPPPLAVAQIELASGARGESLDGARLYRLDDGLATFDVPHVASGERFRVIAGDGLVEVRGTRFEVAVEGGALARVSVSRGRVVVRLHGAEVADLRAGDDWERPALPPARSLTPARSSEPSRTVVPPPPPADALDQDIARARALLRAGDGQRAAERLDALLRRRGLDAGRRADVLFWSAQAHLAAGDTATARSRAEAIVTEHPAAWRAPDAARLIARIDGASDEAAAP